MDINALHIIVADGLLLIVVIISDSLPMAMNYLILCFQVLVFL
jgi:hypothetical protein